jgi:taurine dehydrogenase small subunit
MAQVTTQLLDEIQDGFNRHDVDAILSHFAEDGVWLMARGPNAPEGRRLVGKAAIGEVLRARYQVIRDMRWEEMRHWVFGDKALSEWVVRGTHPETGPFEMLGCDLWEFRGALVTRKDTYWKTIE